MAYRAPSWLIPLLGIALGAGGSYYASGLATEGRLSKLETRLEDLRIDFTEHKVSDATGAHDLWFAISRNRVEPGPRAP